LSLFETENMTDSDRDTAAAPPMPAAGGQSRSLLLTWGVVLFLAAAAVAVDAYFINKSNDFLDRDLRNIIVFSVTAGTLILLSAWLLLRSSLHKNTKAMISIGAAVLLLSLLGMLKFKHFTGDMVPVLVFRWTPNDDALLPELETPQLPAAEAAAIQLVASSPTDFPHFLGPHGARGVPDANLASDWKAHPPKLIWKHPIGGGLSGFAVVGNFAVTQEQRGDEKLLVCYEFLTGEPLWSHSLPGRFVNVLGRDGPRATPTIADGKVYCQWSEGDLTCHAGQSGEVVWSHNLLEQFNAPQISWGRSGSPLVVAEKVIVSAGGPNGFSLVAFNKETGKLIWHAGNDRASYASPVHATLAGVEQVVVVNENWVVGHRLTDGEVLWRQRWTGSSDTDANTTQPVILPDDHVFVSHGYGYGCALFKIVADSSGKLTSHEEIANKTLLKTKMSNVAVRGDYIYGLSGGILECVEWRTLARQWKRGRYGHGQMIVAGDKLLVTVEETGEISLVEASPEKQVELARFQAIEGQTWNPFALVGPYLLLRNESEAACYKLPQAE
jgi:outer membrane protein assembly factor BamB